MTKPTKILLSDSTNIQIQITLNRTRNVCTTTDYAPAP